MNFSFYIFGTPNGYNQYPADNNSTAFQEFAQNNTTESQLTVCRKGQLIYYAYMRRLQEKSSSYLGLSLVFNGVYCQNPQKLFQLFDRAFDDVLMKGKLLRFEKGKAIFTVSKFAEKPLEIERIKTFFKNYLESDFTRDFVALPASFKVGNGKKTISVKETSSEIIAAIAEFDIVHISNNEKSLSELECTHKMLTDLYAEKQELDTKYRKLVAQKKQYNIVLLLCLVVIGCIVGLLIFNKNLQNKDSQLSNLHKEVNQKQADIENLNTKITQLQNEKDKLNNMISKLNENINQKETTIREQNNQIAYINEQIRQKESETSNLQFRNNNLSSELSYIRREKNDLSSELSNKESEIRKLKQPFNAQIYLEKDVYNSSYDKIAVYGPIVITIDPKSNIIYKQSGIKKADIYSMDLKYYQK